MQSQNKLIKQGISYTDKLFDEISKRLEQGVKSSDTLEEFLDKYHKAFPDKENPVISLGYDQTLLDLILSETNNHQFSRPAQKELVRVTIENQVGELIKDVGDDIRDSVREIVKDGYNNNLSQDDIAKNISDKVDSIKNTRARAIARTEIARAATISDYIINAERGATHFYVECRNTACPICKEAWHKHWSKSSDDSFEPSDTSAGGKGWIGDKTYAMSDVGMLPPIHVNCRCVPYFIKKDGSESKQEPTKEQLSQNLTPAERAKYVNYKRSIDNHTKWLRENPNAPVKQIEGHRKRLVKAQQGYDELRVKALGGNVSSEPKPTPKSKPKSKTKPKTDEELPTPTPKQLKENLTPGELRKYKRYQKEIKEGKLSPEFTEQRKRDLENLKRKALGLKPLDDKKTGNQKPKPTKPKKPPETKAPEEQKPTNDQLKKNLTKKELEEYKQLKTEVDWANKILAKSTATPKQKSYAQSRLNEILPRFKELNQKALTGKSIKKSAKKSKTKKKKEEPKAEVTVNKPKNARLTKDEVNSLTFEELAEHHNATYKGLVKNEHDGKEYHVFEQTFDNGKTFTLHFEKGAVNSYNKEGVATANQIIHEVFKVPELLRKETNQIWFKNTQKGIRLNPSGKYDTLKGNVGGYNTHRSRSLSGTKLNGKIVDDPNHRIVINPKSFKKLTKFLDILLWRDTGDSITSWKHIIHHEFIHSIDDSRRIWREGLEKLSSRRKYMEIEKEEPYFTNYANTLVSESFAEHGGYISYMLANPEEQGKKLTIHHYGRDENNKVISVEEKITFEEYKERYPKHYEYFINLLNEEG